jgi:hypothetical protein
MFVGLDTFTYFIRIGSAPGAPGGPGSFSINFVGNGPSNDECESAQTVQDNHIVIASTVGALSELPIRDNCAGGPDPSSSPSVWYRIVGTGSRISANLITLDEDFDTAVFVFCGTCIVPICVASNDNTPPEPPDEHRSYVEWDTTLGTEYFILVTGVDGCHGLFGLGLNPVGNNQGTPVACSGSVQEDLTIGSNAPGVFIQVSPPDVSSLTAGLAPFERRFGNPTQVVITAPLLWNGQDLLGFLIDGRILRAANDGTLVGTVDEAHRLKVIYSDGGAAPSGGVLHRR